MLLAQREGSARYARESLAFRAGQIELYCLNENSCGPSRPGTGAFPEPPQSLTLRWGLRGEGRERESNTIGPPRLKKKEKGSGTTLGEWRPYSRLTSLVGSSLHFSGARIWGWREYIVKRKTEATRGPRRLGAMGVGNRTVRLKRGRVRVQVEPLPEGGDPAPPWDKVPASWGLATRPRAR